MINFLIHSFGSGSGKQRDLILVPSQKDLELLKSLDPFFGSRAPLGASADLVALALVGLLVVDELGDVLLVHGKVRHVDARLAQTARVLAEVGEVKQGEGIQGHVDLFLGSKVLCALF